MTENKELTINDHVYMFVYPAHGEATRINYLNGFSIAVQDPRESFISFQVRTKEENENRARIYVLSLYTKAYEKYRNLVKQKIDKYSNEIEYAFNFIVIVDSIKTFKEFIGNNCVL